MLFTDRSLWTMIHGIVLGGAALMALAAAVFSMLVLPRAADANREPLSRASDASRGITRLMTFIAVVLWAGVFVGTYIIFPLYRATPPEGATDLSQYPRALIGANPDTAWLHSFGMEIKEHVPWIASMIATAAAFAGMRYRSTLLSDAQLRNITTTLLAICFVLVAFVGLMGIFITRVAPLQ